MGRTKHEPESMVETHYIWETKQTQKKPLQGQGGTGICGRTRIVLRGMNNFEGYIPKIQVHIPSQN